MGRKGEKKKIEIWFVWFGSYESEVGIDGLLKPFIVCIFHTFNFTYFMWLMAMC